MKGMTCAILAVVIVAIIGIVRACDALSDYCKEKEKRQVEAEFISEIKETPLGDLTDAKLKRCSGIQSDLQNLCLAEMQKRVQEQVQEQLDNITKEADSLFESGLVREYVKAFLQSEYRNHPYIAERINSGPSFASVKKRIQNLLPEKGCIQDPLQRANFFSTIYYVNNFLDVSADSFEPYFRYAERKCSYKLDDANVLLTEELFVATGVSFGFISQKRANSIYAETFSSLDENDFSFMKNMDNSVCEDVSKKSGRTIAVSCAYKADETISAPTALGISILRLFSALGTSPFVLHHSVNQVQIGYNTIERDFDWYNGFYWTIYDVYIKANRASMMGYLEKTKKCTLSDSKWDCGQRNIFDLKPFLSDEDIEFFSGSVSYGQIKRWCWENGFTCGKRVVTRTRSL